MSNRQTPAGFPAASRSGLGDRTVPSPRVLERGTTHPIDRVLAGRLCSGCGACAFVGEDHGVTMVDYPDVGRRPTWSAELPLTVKDAMFAACPGAGLDAPAAGLPRPRDPDELLVGPTTAIWEGWATDPEIRRAGSSGGVLSALATYAVERLGMALVLHTGVDPMRPWLNRTTTSADAAGVVAQAGSRYAPSSPVEALSMIEASDRPCVFIGKPCDVAAVARLRTERPAIDRNVGLLLSFFCAGTPNTTATLRLAGALGFERPEEITRLSYRGDGWPGEFRISDRSGREASLSYEQSWGALAKRQRQLRCQLCPDGLGELADVTGGDAWHRRSEGSDGISVILARTDLGRRVVDDAAREGYLTITRSDPHAVVRGQGLVGRRRLVAARIAGLRLLGRATPRFRGFHLLAAARQAGVAAQAKELAGTVQRVWTRGYLRPEPRE
jgi:coenzyme F420 hydrogenase subunit beta